MGEHLSVLQVSEAATRYASALLDLASEENVIPQVEAELNAFGAALDASADLNGALSAPTVSAENKVAVIKAIPVNLEPARSTLTGTANPSPSGPMASSIAPIPWAAIS